MRHPQLLVAALTVSVAAQSPAPPSAPFDRGAMLAPIHTGPDDPAGGPYGVWAAGPTFKASFHAGFCFYAYAPERAEHPRLRWTTESVTAGGDDLGFDATHAERSFAGFRHEARSGDVIEAYDVRADGVEQSFVIARRPARSGDLVVTGRVESNLRAERVEPRVGALEFGADGAALVRYGAAVAIDADGDTVPVATGFDGERIRLCVPASFVASARFPLTIDPLLSPILVAGSAIPIVDVAWSGTTAPGLARAIEAHIVRTSATDTDLWAVLCSETAPGGMVVYQDVTTSWSTSTIDAAEVQPTFRWALAFERDFPSSGIVAARVQVLDFAASLGSGTTLFAPNGTTAPRIGGSRDGTIALLVSGTAAGLDLRQVDLATPQLGAAVGLPGSFDDWSISRSESLGTPWCVVAHEIGVGVRAQYVTAAPALGPSALLGAPANAASVEVDGDANRFVATWTELDAATLIRRLRAQRIGAAGGGLALGAVRGVASAPALTALVNGRVAYDYTTQSHWTVTWETSTALTGSRSAQLARLGYQGGVTETASLFGTTQSQGPLLPRVGFDGSFASGQRGTFSALYVDSTHGLQGFQVQRRTLEYPAGARATTYGVSCSNAVVGDGHPPYAGSEFYNVNAGGLPANRPAYLSLGFTPRNVALDVIGMPGCRVLADPVVTLGTTTDAAGIAILYIPLQDVPVFLGDLYAQWVWLQPGANALGVLNSVGLQIQVR